MSKKKQIAAARKMVILPRGLYYMQVRRKGGKNSQRIFMKLSNSTSLEAEIFRVDEKKFPQFIAWLSNIPDIIKLKTKDGGPIEKKTIQSMIALGFKNSHASTGAPVIIREYFWSHLALQCKAKVEHDRQVKAGLLPGLVPK